MKAIGKPPDDMLLLYPFHHFKNVVVLPSVGKTAYNIAFCLNQLFMKFFRKIFTVWLVCTIDLPTT